MTEVLHCSLCTPGDSFMAVAGHNADTRLDHGSRAFRAATDVVKLAKSIQASGETVPTVGIGIHTGFSMASALGHSAPRYTLVGKTVNVAKEIAEGCQPMCIQVSETTHSFLLESLKSNVSFLDIGRYIDTKDDDERLKIWLVQVGEYQAALMAIADANSKLKSQPHTQPQTPPAPQRSPERSSPSVATSNGSGLGGQPSGLGSKNASNDRHSRMAMFLKKNSRKG